MDRKFNFSNFKEPRLRKIAIDLLKIEYGLNLVEGYFSSKKNPDLVQISTQDNSIEVLVKLYDTKEISASIATNINKDIENYVRSFKPQKIILIFFSRISKTAESILFNTFESTSFNNFEVYQVDWIEQQLIKYPNIIERYKISLYKGKNNSTSQSKLFIYYDPLTDKAVFDAIKTELKDFEINTYAVEDVAGHVERSLVFQNMLSEIRKSDLFIAIYSSFNTWIAVENAIGLEKKILIVKSKDIVNVPKKFSFLPIITWQKENLVYTVINILNNPTPASKTSVKSNIRYWWINANSKRWNIDNFNEGDVQSYGTHNPETGNKTQVFANLISAKKGDQGILYQVGRNPGTKAVFRIIKEVENENNDELQFEIEYKFDHSDIVTYKDLKAKSFFRNSEVVRRNNQGSILKLTKVEYDGIIDLINNGSSNHNEDNLISDDEFIFPQKENTLADSFDIAQTSSVINNNDLAHAEKDLLGIEADVEVLASLMALKKMDPPLAIALFGKWGTGKSFFMYQLQMKINELANYQGFLKPVEDEKIKPKTIDGDKYCKGIAQINFNAWSYVDSNLWAGLVNAIFEKLNEYISNSTKSGVAKLKVQSKLAERLKALQALKETQSEKKNRLESLKQHYKQETKKLDHNIIQNIGEGILEINSLESNVKKTFDSLSIDEVNIGENFTINGANLVSEYKYWLNFWKNFKKASQLWQYIVLFIIGCFIVVLLIEFAKLDFDFLYSLPIFTVMVKVVSWFGSKKSAIKKYINQFNKLIEDDSNLKEKVDNLEEKIELVKDQKRQAQEQIDKLDIQIEKVQNEFYGNLNETTIHNFIEDRAYHKDYKDYLGIVSTIRKDFETLSELFLESREEEKKHKQEIINKKVNNDDLNSDRTFITDQFQEGKKLERVILYIDDLDRCSDEKVLEVLQAVHLLMAFPLFIVVVGVDKRCVNNAINLKNTLQYFNSQGIKSLEQLKKEFDIDVIQPNEYLEKIFQIPFQIPDAKPSGVHNMIDELLEGQIKEKDQESGIKDEESAYLEFQNENSQVDNSQDDNSQDDNSQDDNSQDDNLDTKLIEEQQVAEKESLRQKSKDILFKKSSPKVQVDTAKDFVEVEPITPPDLSITNKEKEQIKKLSGLIGNVPRTIKRFVNLYRIIRAHSELSHDSLSDDSKLAIMFLLAINIGEHKKLAEKLFSEINEKKEGNLSKVLKSTDFLVFYNELIENKMESVLNISCKDVRIYLPFVRRFSFGDY